MCKITKEEFKWIKSLKRKGYKFMIMPKGNKKEFFATKVEKRKKNGMFYAEDQFDVFRLEEGEQWIPGSDARGVVIKL